MGLCKSYSADLPRVSYISRSNLKCPKFQRTLTIRSNAHLDSAFTNPPSICPNLEERKSTRWVNARPSERIARRLSENTTLGSHSSTPAKIPRGVMTSHVLV